MLRPWALSVSVLQMSYQPAYEVGTGSTQAIGVDFSRDEYRGRKWKRRFKLRFHTKQHCCQFAVARSEVADHWSHPQAPRSHRR